MFYSEACGSSIPKLVLVRRDERGHDRWLRAWRRDLDGWRGYVGYAVSPGIRYLECVAAERLRQP
jgi:hypothetical protein